ncbi:MAG: hypothetical protein AAGG69_00665 [Pseudomonadota bacterium]
MAKEKMITGKWPVTTFNTKGDPVPPGERNSISEKIAKEIEAIHGKYDDASASVATTTKTVKVADLDDPTVMDAIDKAAETRVNEACTAAREAWLAFTTLPETASPEEAEAAKSAVDAAFGVEAAA